MNSTPRNPDAKTPVRKASSGKTWMPPLNLLGHTVSLVQDVAELEACLALEGSARHSQPSALSSARMAAYSDSSDGLEGPAAIPYCDFLTVRDSSGALAGMARLLAHGQDAPVRNPLSNGRLHLSPLLTAIRYSRLDMVEAGPLVVGPGRDPGRIMALLWRGLLRYLERSGATILLGREYLAPNQQGAVLASLRASYGLHPDLEVEALASFRAQVPWPQRSGRENAYFGLPSGLQEALDRGCRLAGEPALNADRSALEVIWVATRDMLSQGEDWRRDTPDHRPAPAA